MMLYKKMLEDLISYGKKAAVLLESLPATIENIRASLFQTDFPVDDFFDLLRIDYKDSFSDEFLRQLSELGVHRLLGKTPLDTTPITILDIFKGLLLSLSRLPSCSPDLTLRYEHQKTKNNIGEVKFSYDAALLNENIQTSLEYLFEVRQPTGVTDIEEASYKCGNCRFAENCDWRESMAQLHSKINR